MSARTPLPFKLFALTISAAAVCPTAAQAANNVSYISTGGSNANLCTQAAPCRSLQRAHNVTRAGGEVRILGSGFFGNNATIRKSLTISGNGNTVLLGNSITIDEPGAVVTLRDLTLNGRGTVADGISIIEVAAVRIERCVIYGFTFNGITASAVGAEIFLLDSAVRDNGNSGAVITSASALAVEKSHFDNNSNDGLHINGGRATIANSTAYGNASNGIIADVGVSASVTSTRAAQNGDTGFVVSSSSTMTLESSMAHANNRGLWVGSIGSPLARLSNSAIIGHTIGISNAGTVETLQNNIMRDNSTPISGSPLTPINDV